MNSSRIMAGPSPGRCHSCSCSQHSMMNRLQPVSTQSKQILNDSVNMQETLSVVG